MLQERADPKFFRRVIKITAQDSPNVQRALLQMAAGQEPDGKVVLEGVLTWQEYQQRRATWDAVRQCVGLDASFYEGAQLLLFPPEWLNRSQSQALNDACQRAPAEAIGIDPAEGGDSTSMAAVNRLGVKEVESMKTPNTAAIPGMVIAFGKRHNVPSDKWCFDRGGGGKQHADQLRQQGHHCQTVAFGEAVIAPLRRRGGLLNLEQRVDVKEEQYAYVNRRAQMVHQLSLLFDPDLNPAGFALPSRGGAAVELRRQLAVVPRAIGDWTMYDPEGRIRMLPKSKRNPDSSEMTLTQLVGHSPDEMDSVCVAVHAMTAQVQRPTVTGF